MTTAPSESTSLSGAIPHHRHPLKGHTNEASPLVPTTGEANSWKDSDHAHLKLSMGDDEESRMSSTRMKASTFLSNRSSTVANGVALVVLGLMLATFVALSTLVPGGSKRPPLDIIPFHQAEEHWLDISAGNTSKQQLQIWFRTWGNPQTGTPVLFVHGGPGNAIADYYGHHALGNRRFFDPSEFWVVEVDQRGTGNSRPSVREGFQNMHHYQDISIDQIGHDFELIRRYLGIRQWLVWGGSFGSTLAINYGERYPHSCLALIIRGVYLDTAEEVYTVYSRKTYLDNPKRRREFDILFDYAAQYHNNQTNQPPLDPNDAQGLLQVYARLIAKEQDPQAAWHWFVFENNLMELDPRNLLDPKKIRSHSSLFAESLSVAFFETRLWLHGSFEAPTSDLLDVAKLDRLTMPMWICQGQRDEVCPPKYARRFAQAVEERNQSPRIVSRFLNATHEDTDPVIEDCLRWSLREFVDYQATTRRSD